MKITRKIKYTGLAIIVSLCAGICVMTGCFSEKQPEPIMTGSKNSSYNTLISQWNSAVLAADLDSSYELSRDDHLKLFKKLNSFFANTETYEDFSNQNQCTLKQNKKIFIPSFAYAEFLKNNQLSYNVHFNGRETEDEIIRELKKNTNSKYIDSSMLEKIVYLHNFKAFFENNKKQFYKEGFSKHIKDFKIYQEAVKKCK